MAHVTRIEPALKILEEGVIRARPVGSADGRLGNGETKVVWLSPNHWKGKDGYLYGNVRFNFRLSDVVGNRSAYWVEIMKSYENPASRILLASKGHRYARPLEDYFPADGDGPWWHTPEMDYYNCDRKCLMFMLADDLPMSLLYSVNFVDHFPKQKSTLAAATEFLSVALFLHGPRLNVRIAGVPEKEVDNTLRDVLTELCCYISSANCSFGGPFTESSPGASDLLGVILNPKTTDEERAATRRLFRSANDLKKTFKNLACDKLSVPTDDYVWPEDFKF